MGLYSVYIMVHIRSDDKERTRANSRFLAPSSDAIQVETAKSGAEGLERIGENMPDILFLDIGMPVMDGPKVLERLFEPYGKDSTVAVAVTATAPCGSCGWAPGGVVPPSTSG